MAEAAHAGLVADRLRNRLAERDADVFHGVMRVDIEIALRFDVEIDHAVPRDLVEHVLEEGQPGGEPGDALAVQVDLHADLGLLGVAGDFSGPHCRASRNAFTSIRFSSGVPTVTRRHCSSAGLFRFRTSTPWRLSASKVDRKSVV